MTKEKSEKKERKMKEKPKKTESKKIEKPKKKLFAKKEKAKTTEHVQKQIKVNYPKQRKSQKLKDEKKTKLAVKGRQTKWTPVWVIMKKHGTGKRIHPSAMTRYRRGWRRNKLKIKPRKVRKWHMG